MEVVQGCFGVSVERWVERDDFLRRPVGAQGKPFVPQGKQACCAPITSGTLTRLNRTPLRRHHLGGGDKMRFARIVFAIAGMYGIVVLVPPLFLESKFGRDYPPPVTHPEFFYGFFALGIAWQILFLILATDPIKYRAMMIPCMLEK